MFARPKADRKHWSVDKFLRNRNAYGAQPMTVIEVEDHPLSEDENEAEVAAENLTNVILAPEKALKVINPPGPTLVGVAEHVEEVGELDEGTDLA